MCRCAMRRATSAAPAYFRAHKSGDYLMIDGGVWGNNPVMIAVVEALSCFDITPRQIKVLSLGCVESEYRVGWMKADLGGIVPWWNVIFGAMRLQSQAAIGQAGLLIGRDRLFRLDCPPIAPAIGLDDWSRSCEILPGKAKALVDEHGGRIAAEFLDVAAAPYEPIYSPANPPLTRAA